MTFSTPVTPTRERLTRVAGRRDCTSVPRSGVRSVIAAFHDIEVRASHDELGRLRHDLGSASEVMQVLRDLPVRDPGAVALDLKALDREEHLDELRVEGPAQDRVTLERLEGCV